MTLYTNLYEANNQFGRYQFIGRRHGTRLAANFAAAEETRVESRTRRIGLLRVTLKEGVRD